MDTITIKIRSSSEECERIREDGLFFETISDALFIGRNDVKEVIPPKNKTKQTKWKFTDLGAL